MLVSAKVKNGSAIHSAIDMGGFYYISCHADRSTMKTEVVSGEITCKKCISIKTTIYPNYCFLDGVHALKHPFCKTKSEHDGFSAGYNDGYNNLKKYIVSGLNEEFLSGYEKGYNEGIATYTHSYNNGSAKEKPVISKKSVNSTNNKNKATQAGCSTFILSFIVLLALLISHII